MTNSDRHASPTSYHRIVVDERLLEMAASNAGGFSGWGSRALYEGDLGAQNWMGVVTEPNYPLRDGTRFQLAEHRLQAIEHSRVRTFVSLGPGDGLHDLPLIEKLNRNATLQYIPVDISRSLLELAINTVTPVNPVLVGIQCDFEVGFPFLSNVLIGEAERPILFSFLGGTIGNLDHGLSPFFDQLQSFMQPGDEFLLDLPIAGPEWNRETEPRLRHECYSNAFRQFLASGVAKYRSTNESDYADVRTKLLDQFSEKFELALTEEEGTGAMCVTVKEQSSNLIALRLRRFDWHCTLSWFHQRGFRVTFAKFGLDSVPGKFGMGVVLLTLPEKHV